MKLGVLEFHELGSNFLEVLHYVLIVVVLYEVGILYYRLIVIYYILNLSMK